MAEEEEAGVVRVERLLDLSRMRVGSLLVLMGVRRRAGVVEAGEAAEVVLGLGRRAGARNSIRACRGRITDRAMEDLWAGERLR